MKKTAQLLFFLLFLPSTFYVLHSRSVRAQSAPVLIVAPARQELYVEPGEKTAINVKFLNEGDVPVSGTLQALDFVVEGKEGTPKFLEENLPSRFSASSWLSLPLEKATIAPKNKVLLNIKINVPKDALPGGRYTAVVFDQITTPAGQTGQKAGELAVSTRIASLVYIRVAGPIKEQALVTKFSGQNFSEYGPVVLTTEILNRGNYHIRPKATINVYNLIGKLVAQEFLPEENIFPDASRLFENKVGQKWMFGKYKATLTVGYGEKNQVLEAQTYFWVIPWKEISAVILAVVIIVMLVLLFTKEQKEKEEKLLKKLAREEEELKELKEQLKKKKE